MSDLTNIPKRIVICCDGTWQSSVSGEKSIPSNVTRLCRLIARSGKDKDNKTWQQVVYYDSGVGTGSLTGIEKKRQGAVGDGLAINVIEAYNFIVLNYSPGDEIFCFGFSRGAYTARAVAGLVADLGIMEPRNLQIFPDIYDIYKKNIPRKVEGRRDFVQLPFRESDGWKEWLNGKRATTPEAVKLWEELDKVGKKPEGEESRIAWETRPHLEVAMSEESRNVKVVGVWDTVGALGVPDGRFTNHSGLRAQYGFHNVKLNKNIEHAFQALALDERRKAFSPTLWYIPKTRTEKADLLQVWFPGVHINIGGGSSDTAEGKGDAEQMANITFAWMVECIRPYLALNSQTIYHFVNEYNELLEDLHFQNKHPEIELAKSNVAVRTYKKVYNSLPYIFSSPPPTAPVNAGWGTADYIDSFTGLMQYPGQKLRTPGACETEIVVENESYVTSVLYDELMEAVPLKDLGETNEMIHPVARFRNEQAKKGAKKEVAGKGGLQGWTARRSKTGKGWEWAKDGNTLTLPEYVIEKERKLVAGDFQNGERGIAGYSEEAVSFLNETDKVNGLA